MLKNLKNFEKEPNLNMWEKRKFGENVNLNLRKFISFKNLKFKEKNYKIGIFDIEVLMVCHPSKKAFAVFFVRRTVTSAQ